MARMFACAVALSASFMVIGGGIGVAPARAQDCKDRVTASGAARPTVGWARSLATNMWRRQVQAKFGEQYEDIKYAQHVNYVCSPTSFGRRCTLTARPCIVPGTISDAERHTRSNQLARDLQRELQRLGCYGGPIDGDWGEGSRRALERFARRVDADLKTDEPSMRALRAVEETERRVCRG